MNQRSVTDNGQVIPVKIVSEPKPDEPAVEELVFDKAEEAEQANKEKSVLIAALDELKVTKKEAGEVEKQVIESKIEEVQNKLKGLEQRTSE